MQQDLQIMMDPHATLAEQTQASMDFVLRMEFWRGLLKATAGDGGSPVSISTDGGRLQITDAQQLMDMRDEAIVQRLLYNNGKGAAASAVVNIMGDDGMYMSADASAPDPAGAQYNLAKGDGGGPQCAECQLALKIDQYAQKGGKLPNVIVMVEQQRAGRPPCGSCQLNVPKILGKYDRPIVIYNASDMSAAPYVWIPPGWIPPGTPVA
jgi:hypothetical protein